MLYDQDLKVKPSIKVLVVFAVAQFLRAGIMAVLEMVRDLHCLFVPDITEGGLLTSRKSDYEFTRDEVRGLTSLNQPDPDSVLQIILLWPYNRVNITENG